MADLVIVESPAKSRTLKKFLGRKYKILASGGHLVDLPHTTLAVDIEHDFKPKYRVISGKEDIVKQLKEAAETSDKIYLASDPDREGEAIAWHIQRILKLNPDRVYRAVFNEITRKAVLDGIHNPSKIDTDKVDAQQARRVLDRLVGYKVSPVLWYALYKGLSAGRVQSVALRLIAEREAEIDAFVPQEYYDIFVELDHDDTKFWAKLDKIDGKKVQIGTIPSEADAIKIIEFVKEHGVKIDSVNKKDVKRNPSPPLKTSTLQLRAHSVLGFTASRTMKTAQTLYEGISLGDEGHVGLITYMRTDSLRIADDAIDAAEKHIKTEFGDKFHKMRRFKTGKKAQDAHESIRPTNPELHPDKVKSYLTNDQFKLYDLIYRHFLATQMSEAVFEETTINASSEKYSFKVSESLIKFDGFLAVYPKQLKKEKEKVAELPVIKDGETVDLSDSKFNKKETSPPSRFSEGTLVQELEKNGVGRPSTYAQIISTLFNRKYIIRADGKLKPTDLGREVEKILVDKFPDLFNISFTAHMEEDLDEVEDGKKNWIKLLHEFYSPFEKHLTEVLETRKEMKKKYEEVTDKKCEKCGRPMIVKWGPHGKFLACSGYPECRNAQPLESEQEKLPEHIKNMKCPKCGKAVTIKHARKGAGKFIGCTGYPECDFIAPYYLGHKCPKPDCNGELIERVTRRGKVFVGCSNYPDCDFATWDSPADEECPDCGAKPTFIKSTKSKTFRYCGVCDWAEGDNKKPKQRKYKKKTQAEPEKEKAKAKSEASE